MVDSTGNLRFQPGDFGFSIQAGTGFGNNFNGNSSFSTHVTDPGYKTPESQGMILNLNFRPSGSFEINASFEYSKGNRKSRFPFIGNF